MTEVISVRFRGGCKSYFFDPGQLKVVCHGGRVDADNIGKVMGKQGLCFSGGSVQPVS